MELLSRAVLRTLEAYESEHTTGPTVPELATDLGIPPDFGHVHLAERLRRQVILGRVSHYGGRFQLTEAGRAALARDAAREAQPRSEPVTEPEPASTTP